MSIDPSLSQPSVSSKDEDDMEASSSSATTTEALGPQDEKDARDRLTPTALLVYAASGVVVHNACDLETGDVEEEKVDKILASVPPSLERQTARPSQPGAFRAGGDPQRNAEAEEASDSRITGPPAGLIEATLVEEAALPSAATPIYKGQIVFEEDDASSPDKENVVTFSKKQVRLFLLAFVFLCLVAIVLSVVVTLVRANSDGDDDGERNDIPKGYWYEDKPEELWKMLQERPYISHHVALVSIVNPHLTMVSVDDDAGSLQCSPLRGDFDSDDQRRSLRRDDSNVVVVSFTCGSEPSMLPSVVNGAPLPDAVILMHDGSAEAVNGKNRTISCQDAKQYPNGTLKYNQVFCAIPNDGQMDDSVLSFFFSCFSRIQPEPVAAVQSLDASAKCRRVNDNSTTSPISKDEMDAPQVLVTAPAAILLSTQRLCRGSNDVALQSSILAEDWRNRSQDCSQDWRGNDDSDLLVCLSPTLPVNDTISLTALSVCASNNWTDPCVEVRLPNVTIYDEWPDDRRECAPASLDESLLVKGDNDLPLLQAFDNETLEELQVAIGEQERWVEQWLLFASR